MDLKLIYIIAVVVAYVLIEIGTACCDPSDRRDTTIIIQLKVLGAVMLVALIVVFFGSVVAKEAFNIPIYL